MGTVKISASRSGDELNIYATGTADHPAVLTWITVEFEGGGIAAYPPFNVGGDYVFPGLTQLKATVSVSSDKYTVKAYYCDSNGVAECTS